MAWTPLFNQHPRDTFKEFKRLATWLADPTSVVGTGAAVVYPVQVQADMLQPFATVGVFATDRNDGYYYNLAALTAGNQNDELEWRLLLQSGTWKLQIVHSGGANRGIYDVKVDGTSVGTSDGYSATNPTITAVFTGIVVATTAVVPVKVVMSAKHGSSSAYYSVLSALSMTRTGA